MDILLILKALILGLVEAASEFLPISSTGHLIIVGDFLNFIGSRAETFEIFIQLGAILAVVWIYRARLLDVATHLDRDPSARRLVLNLIVAFIPAAVFGLLLHKAITHYLFNPVTVAAALVVGGIVILLVERYARADRVQRIDQMSGKDALLVGIAQCLALFPGFPVPARPSWVGCWAGCHASRRPNFPFSWRFRPCSPRRFTACTKSGAV